MRFEQAALSVASDLDALKLSYALIGGFAVSIRTDPRFTQHIDLVVAVTDDEAAESAVNRLVARGYTILAVVEHEAQSRLATVRLELPEEELLLARDAVDLIEERGYARGRDLGADLGTLVADDAG
jgi:hypothetical protein